MGAMLLLAGCGGDGYTPELRAIDTIINEKPDSALHLLGSLSTEAAAWPAISLVASIVTSMKRPVPSTVILTPSTTPIPPLPTVTAYYYFSHPLIFIYKQ